jgi:endogenous inhibitor of DNA gyrase (YacG/DUF329 family)
MLLQRLQTKLQAHAHELPECVGHSSLLEDTDTLPFGTARCEASKRQRWMSESSQQLRFGPM